MSYDSGLSPRTGGSIGPPGVDGAPGASAYDLWLGRGNTGTVDDFLASLRGADGAAGTGGGGSGLDQTAADGRYQRQRGLVDELPTPFYIGHRGGGLVMPEHTIEAYEEIAAHGIAIECDLYLLSDGTTFVPCHDATLDRTTTQTGNISSLSLNQWRQVRVKSLVAGGLQVSPPTWLDVLDKFGGRALLSVETKVGGTATIDNFIATLAKRGLKRDVMHSAFSFTDCQRVLAAGIESAPAGDTLNPGTVKAAGFKYVTVSSVATQAYVDSLTAIGLKVIRYSYNTVASATSATSTGASGIYSDDPLWVTQRFGRKNIIDFTDRKGWAGWKVPANSGFNFRRNEFGIGVAGGAAYSPGAALPLFHIAPPGATSRWRFPIRWVPSSTVDSTSRIAFFIGNPAADSATQAYNGNTFSGMNGYAVRMMLDGTIAIDKVANNLTVDTATASTPAVSTTVDTVRQLEVTIGTSTVTVTDTVTGATATLTDAAYRPTAPVLVARWTLANVYIGAISVEPL